MSPRVSVVMAVRDGERYLREAVESILGQTFTDFEFIVVDDGSADRSAEVVCSYGDPRVVLVRNGRGLGLTASLNRGLDLARGEYVARMDADDVSLPERLARQVAIMDAHPEVGACGTWALEIDEEGRVVGRRENYVGETLDALFWRESLIHPSAMFRFDPAAGPRYDPEVRYAQDYELWLRIRRSRRLENLPEHLLLYRVHGAAITARNRGEQMLSVYRSFCKHVWGGALPRETFFTLIGYSREVNPFRRALASARLARRLGKPFRVFLDENVRYAKQWWGLGGRPTIFGTGAVKALREFGRQSGK